jgi:hypothetical protein
MSPQSGISQSSVICAEVDHGADDKSRPPASSPRRPGRLQDVACCRILSMSFRPVIHHHEANTLAQGRPAPRRCGRTGNVWNVRLMLRLSRRLGPLRGCQWFAENTGQGRALHSSGKHYFFAGEPTTVQLCRSLGPIPKSFRRICAIARMCRIEWRTPSSGFEVAASDPKISVSPFEKFLDFFGIDLALCRFRRD